MYLLFIKKLIFGFNGVLFGWLVSNLDQYIFHSQLFYQPTAISYYSPFCIRSSGRVFCIRPGLATEKFKEINEQRGKKYSGPKNRIFDAIWPNLFPISYYFLLYTVSWLMFYVLFSFVWFSLFGTELYQAYPNANDSICDRGSFQY